MKFRVLGSIEADLGEGALPLPPKPRHLLAVLLTQPGLAVSTEYLVDALWGDRPPRTVRKNLQVQICNLRNMLGGPKRIARHGAGYSIDVCSDEVDVPIFEHLLSTGRRHLEQGSLADGAEILRGALALWRGPAYDGIETLRGVSHEYSRLTELRLTAMEDVFEAELALGRHREVLPEMHGAAREHPYRERLLLQLLLATYRDGQPNRAIAFYHDIRKMFVRELGSDPSPRLRELYQAMLNEDPRLDLDDAPDRRVRSSAFLVPSPDYAYPSP